MMRATTETRQAVRKGERTREGILRVAVDLASVEGLEGLSIGHLAKTLKMSKSGLFAHFGSKRDLQLATIEMARSIFVDYVVHPALAEPAGIQRLWKLCDRWIGHVEEKVFAGGCFFSAASFEFDSRPGPVRTAIVAAMKEWLGILTRAVEEAKKAGHIKDGVNASSFALEIYSIAVGSQWAFQLLDEKRAHRDARETILSRIRSQVTSAARRGEFARLLKF